MRIAVTYENGEVFQHFGHSEQFKIYEIQGENIESEILDVSVGGHDAVAGLLAEQGVNLVLCGGLGDGAYNALNEAGILVISGVSGDADKVVDAFLNGELESEGVNCDHHHDEEGGCGGCGGGCGGCGGGCGGCGGGAPYVPPFDGPNVGKVCSTHYRGTFNDGTVFDSSYDRGEPLQFVCGTGMMIVGYDRAVANMKVGEKVTVHLMPEDAYGPSDPMKILTIDVAQMPGSEELEVGQMVALFNGYQEIPALVTAREGDSITFDLNDQMAGKELNFEIELVEVRDEL